MNHIPIIDIIKFGDKVRIRNGEYQPRNAWINCPLHFVHESDFWAPEQRHHLDWYLWPKNGSDYAFVIGLNIGYQQIKYKTIKMNEINFIHTCDQITIKINTIEFEYLFEFTNPRNVMRIFNLIYSRIPCFNWDLIITNSNLGNYCLLNINYSKIQPSDYDEIEDDDDNEINEFPYVPPSTPRIDGQSTSKSNF